MRFLKKTLNSIAKILAERNRPKRSSEWPKLEKEFLKNHPRCEACGVVEHLQVHHIMPFHLNPDLELETTNLITLCMADSDCHLKIGHGGNWKAYNPNLKKDIEDIKKTTLSLLEAWNRSKNTRRF